MRFSSRLSFYPRHYTAPERVLIQVDAALACLLILLPNVIVGVRFAQRTADASFSSLLSFTALEEDLSFEYFAYWCAMNLILVAMLLVLRQHLLVPLNRMLYQLHTAMTTIAQDKHHATPSLLNMRMVAGDMARFAMLAQEYYRKHFEVSQALEEARTVLAQVTLQQSNLLASTSRELVVQYQSVLSYANYLDEHITTTRSDSTLRYNFDDVCESGFNLKLIADALTLLRSNQSPPISPVAISELMKQTMLTLAPSLDRRVMKLTTAEVDTSVQAMSNPAIVAHILWMMLLGTIRYAAHESTLRMRCLYNRERTQAIVSIVVSELSPGQLSSEERRAHLLRQLQHLTPHMFAETIRVHANIQLAELLVKRLDGEISVVPLTSHACEICLKLPA